MKVYVEPPKHLSRAMFRVAAALKKYAPINIKIVDKEYDADVLVHHVIGSDAISYRPNRPCAVIQYCYKTAGEGNWNDLWSRAKVVWSYYRLPTNNLYLAPLGIDSEFVEPFLEPPLRSIGVVTSGYVSGPEAEAIQEVAHAANAAGLTTVHVGPMPVGVKGLLPETWRNVHDITDKQLADIYRHAKWVSGLRHIEGFELPVVEGMSCGARPIIFNREEMRHWYGGYAEIIPEQSGAALVHTLTQLFAEDPRPMTNEIGTVRRKFDWQWIIDGFWSRFDE